MKKRYLFAVPLLAFALMGSANGCGVEDDRLDQLREVCTGKGDVVALDDGVVACGDGTVLELDVDDE